MCCTCGLCQEGRGQGSRLTRKTVSKPLPLSRARVPPQLGCGFWQGPACLSSKWTLPPLPHWQSTCVLRPPISAVSRQFGVTWAQARSAQGQGEFPNKTPVTQLGAGRQDPPLQGVDKGLVPSTRLSHTAPACKAAEVGALSLQGPGPLTMEKVASQGPSGA